MSAAALLERRLVEPPLRRPQRPQQPADVVPVLGEAGAAALGVEVVLVPAAVLLLGALPARTEAAMSWML